jgi:2,4-dienoyl-CoA reductase-like NADH-dependent reductase (Old Yellow Enzyme family)
MWHPKPFTLHQIPPARWPDAAEATASRWMNPLEVGRLRLRERTWVPAMVPWRATEDGLVTDDVLDWYERFAEGRPGAIVVEATGIRDVPSGPLLRIGHDRFVPGLRELVETVRHASGGETRLFIQLIDFLAIRRRPSRETFLGRYLEITPRLRALVPGTDEEIRGRLLRLSDEELRGVLDDREWESLAFGYRERVTDLHLPHVRELPRTLPPLFAAAAQRAARAGFDGVELHIAHAYTLASFLSALNDRCDGYGGARENRVKLPLEVLAAVRAAVSPAFVVGCRMLSDECIEGGSGVEDAAWFAARFAEAGMDYISLSRGGKFEDAKQPRVGWARYPYTGPSGYECMPTVRSDEAGPFGRNLPATARIRAAVREAGCDTPIVACGGISTFEQAEGVIARGEADVVASARQSLADPDWFRKVRLGRGAEVRRCVFTNYCEGLDQVHKPVSCKLWDRVNLDEPGIRLVEEGKRRLVAPRWQENGVAEGGPPGVAEARA